MDFADEIIKWYCVNKRDLPWRNTKDPYLIWLSEIILQQTRVNQGLPYYEKFVDTFPTISDLARATEEQVLKLWQGLGYYSRARNLHFTAKHIVDNFNGIFPSSYQDLIQLKGIGPYTAAAISSFSVNEPHAVLDGNVFRVLSRFFGIEDAINSTEGLKTFKALAQDILPAKKADLYNQAIMEFGALQCKAASPDCLICPLQIACYALRNQKVQALPSKLKKLKVKNRYFNYFICRNQDQILMKKRLENDIWQHLYDFPCIETVTNFKGIDLLLKGFVDKYHVINDIEIIPVKLNELHKLTHQNILINFFEISISIANFISSRNREEFFWVKEAQISSVPTPKPITNFFTKNYNKLKLTCQESTK